jgi:hypothetical protein
MTVMNIDIRLQVLEAIRDQGSVSYNTPSGAILTLLTKLTSEGNLVGVSEVYNLFSEARSANAVFVQERVPAKILNGYLLGLRQLDATAVEEWEAQNRDWSSRIKAKLSNPAEFERAVVDIEQAITAWINARNS